MKKEEVELNLYPTKSECKIIFFKKDGKKIKILSNLEKKISMDNRIFIEKTFRNEYINELSNCIINERLKYGKCKSMFINIQESDIILKNIKVDSAIKKKDIIKAVNIEINEFCSRTLNDYFVDYKILYNNEEDTEVQIILFPKKYVDLFSEVCDKIGIENRAMHTNVNLLERLLKIKGEHIMEQMKKMGKENTPTDKVAEMGVIEFRNEDLVVSVYAQQKVKYCCVIKKEEFTDELADKIFKNCVGIIGLGNTNTDDIEIYHRLCKLCNIEFEEDVEFMYNHERVSPEEFFQITAKKLN